jgi:3-dehydroquinate synthase
MAVERVFLVGLSGSGKSTVGRLLAEKLGWEFADSDRLLEEREGRSIPEIMGPDREHEVLFRELEAATLQSFAAEDQIVVATGGGAPTTPIGRSSIETGLVIWLDVSPEMAARRLSSDPRAEERPLLAGGLLPRLAELLAERKQLYERSDYSVAVDYYSPEQAAQRIAAIVADAGRGSWCARKGRFDEPAATKSTDVAARVSIPGSLTEYPVVVADGAMTQLGAVCRERGLTGRAFLLADGNVPESFVLAVREAFSSAGYPAITHAIAAREELKTLATVAGVYDWMLGERVERSDFLVCVGGGVLTDLGGFAAATVLRGIPFVHVPTTLLGMVDAAIGGKTGVDHALGKNMVGAFAQPAAVVIDPQVLESLPDRHLRNGWAEVVKHGLILDEGLFSELEHAAGDPAAMRSARLIGWSTRIKAAVVSGDEREAGARTLLNYGHTVGHAIEAVTGYQRELHGEAVAIGMRAAGLISVALGVLSAADFERQQRVLRACGLPESVAGLDVDAVIAATAGDKKARAGSVRWVLLRRIGEAYVHGPVPPEVVREAVAAVCTP